MENSPVNVYLYDSRTETFQTEVKFNQHDRFMSQPVVFGLRSPIEHYGATFKGLIAYLAPSGGIVLKLSTENTPFSCIKVRVCNHLS